MATYDRLNVRMGINPISWSNDGMRDLGAYIPLSQCLSEARQAGYDGIEMGHKFPKDAVALRDVLGEHDLSLVSGWHCTFLSDEAKWEEEQARFRAHLSLLQALGCDVVIVAECTRNRCSTLEDPPRKSGEEFLSAEEWERFVDRLQELGKISLEAGLKLVYHHHKGMAVETMEEIDRLMTQTDPAFVWLLFDSGHALYSGIDPRALLEKYASRVAHVHLKDIRREVLEEVREHDISFNQAILRGVFTVPGDGCIDYAPLFEILNDAGYAGWLVVEAEQDPDKANPLEYATKGRAYIRRMLGA